MNNRFSFGVVTSLFFIWGFLTSMNDILIPYLKGVFVLSYAQAMLVQFAFFMAYFIGSLAYFFISAQWGDPINKIGYKNGMIVGLLMAAAGLALFYPAAQFHVYGFFLSALFVLGLGFTVLQIAANPYVAILGSPATASGRLNLAQGFNSFGTTIAPVVGGYLIFELFSKNSTGADAVKIPYLIFSGITVLVALVLGFIKLPAFTNEEHVEHSGQVFRFPQLTLGVIAIFMYVGGEVCIGSMMTNFVGLKEIAGLAREQAPVFVSLYWGGLMIGRFTGSAALSDLSKKIKITLAFIIPLIVYPFLVFIFYIKGFDWHEALPYMPFLLLLAIGFIAARFHPARTLMFFSVINIGLLLITLSSSGKIALFTVVAAGLFNSIMWSNIFTLAIHNLGKYTSQGSSLLVMGILGGAILPWIMGFAADNIGVQASYIIPAICFVYLAFYGWRVRNLL
ncbi:MAG TPA: sugar MFS transporter [Chitinophagales bacterium]|nr:sugar MFS transporter [Chitinophagales bacterium]